MSKKVEQKEQQPTIADEFQKNGKAILTANTREELFAKFNELKASAKDVTLSTGAIGQKDDGTFSLKVFILKS